jgi:hypothetical protein
MSIKVSVYVPALTKELLPKIVARFGDFGMQCEFDPKFAADPFAEEGAVQVRLRVNSSPVPQYENVDMLSGFDISFKDYRYASPLAFSPTTNEKLKHCTRVAIIRMQAVPTSALRVGSYFAAFLAEQTDGVLYTPRSDRYVDGQQAVEQMKEEITSYETDLPRHDWKVVPFTAWS